MITILCKSCIHHLRNNLGNSKMTEITKQMAKMHTKVLFVGLGNHDMLKTRHSVGMLAVRQLARHLDVTFNRDRKLQSFVARATLQDDDHSVECILMMPTVPMNINGKSVAKVVTMEGVSVDHVLLLQDDLDKPVGRFRLKEAGSAGAHNGVKSVIGSLKTDNIPRLKIGIDRPANQNDVINYVLQKFSTDDSKTIQAILDPALKLALGFMAKRTGVDSKLLTDVIKMET